LTVAVSADNVSVMKQSRDLSRHVFEQQHSSIVQDTDEPVWQHAIGKLESLLASMQIKPKTQLQVILSSDFVRYLILPPQLIPMSSTEKSAYAAAAYREVYGTVVGSWHIKLHDASPNQATIAVAVDEKLLETLNLISLKHQLKLVSVQPYLMRVFNSLRNQLGNLNGYLVILDSGRLLVMGMHQGQCQNLRASVIGGNDWKTELEHFLVRESLLNGADNREVLIYAATQKITVLNNIEGWNIRLIGGATKKTFGQSLIALQGASA
jgi:hypothetical protein